MYKELNLVVYDDGSGRQCGTLHHACEGFPSELFTDGRGRGEEGGGIKGERAPLKKRGKHVDVRFMTGGEPKLKRGGGQANVGRSMAVSRLNEIEGGSGGQPNPIV